jgi:hypothetical protein
MAKPSIPKPTQLAAYFNGTRVVLVKTTALSPYVMRTRSEPFATFSFAESCKELEIDLLSTDLVIVNDVRADYQALSGKIAAMHSALPMRRAPEFTGAAFRLHSKALGVADERALLRDSGPLPAFARRMLNRLGRDGYALVAGQNVCAKSKAASRLAAATYLAYKKWSPIKPLNDDLARELLAWNLVSQSFFTLENFGAFFAARKVTKSGDYKAFSRAYLSFGRGESGLESTNIMSTLSELSGKHAHARIAETFKLPLNAKTMDECGLKDCGIANSELIKAGKLTRDVMSRAFADLASLVIMRDANGRTVRTAAAHAYGAFRHGFAVSIPVLTPGPFATAIDTARFRSDDEFEAYVKATMSLGEFAHLDDSGKVHHISPPFGADELRPWARTIIRCSFWIREFAKYAQSLYGSVDGRFPYLINSSLVLGAEQRAVLQRRLDELEGHA